MMNRRSFVKSLAGGAATLALVPKPLFARGTGRLEPYFGVNPFIESHPSAVFIMRTSVDVKTNSTAVREAGLAFGSSVFVPMSTSGVPLTHRVVIKANVAKIPSAEVCYMGVVTDAHFVEGMIESIKGLGMPGSQISMREAGFSNQFVDSGYTDMALRTGIDLREQGYTVGEVPEEDIVWVDVPNGKWFRRIPYVWPLNAPDTWLLNIAKFKTHSMGMTLCAKNLQGTNAKPYIRHCTEFADEMTIPSEDVQPDAKLTIQADYNRHVQAGIPRWDRPGQNGGIWQEIWAARCLDNNSVLRAGLNVIEGVYGREGAYRDGPGADGLGIDHMTNLVIFGKNPFHVDIIGNWLGGHEPGNFGLFHVALERGLATILNPKDIPVYEWTPDGIAAGTAVETTLEDFPRYQLRTQYLRRDYSGQTEDDWHLVAEPYAYPQTVSRDVATEDGWNIVSLPVAVVNPSLTTLFPTASSDAFEYQNGYVSTDHLVPGKGYWVKFPQPATVTLVGAPIGALDVPVQEGWNLLGPLAAEVPSGAIATTPSDIVESSYFSFDHGYAVADVLTPGRGYWVKASQEGVLHMASGASKAIARDGDLEASSIRLEIKDVRGHCGVLLLAQEEPMSGRSELPPLPPVGIFDVRFASDRWIEQRGQQHVVRLTCVAYPITIEASNLRGVELRVRDAVGAGLVDGRLRDGSLLSLPVESGNLIIEDVGGIAAEFKLDQNYPNPFNPTTVIKFSVPTDSHVRVSVFNTAGQRVTVLVNEELKAGAHAVTFDGTGMASGPYFCQMEAVGRSIVKRMLLLK